MLRSCHVEDLVQRLSSVLQAMLKVNTRVLSTVLQRHSDMRGQLLSTMGRLFIDLHVSSGHAKCSLRMTNPACSLQVIAV